jgi:hypothetical protein
MKWEPNKMSLGDAPGFLFSWWWWEKFISTFHLRLFLYFSVFWDLYSAAPERRDQHPHSEEAKAFHDYVNLLWFFFGIFMCVQYFRVLSIPIMLLMAFLLKYRIVLFRFLIIFVRFLVKSKSKCSTTNVNEC